jgi:hypothetical protein
VYRTILVGTDERERSRDALALGRVMAERTTAELVGVCVYASRVMGNRRVYSDPNAALAHVEGWT